MFFYKFSHKNVHEAKCKGNGATVALIKKRVQKKNGSTVKIATASLLAKNVCNNTSSNSSLAETKHQFVRNLKGVILVTKM